MNVDEFAPRLGSPATRVVITGGASGIGLASAHALAAVGRPVALWDINEAGVVAAGEEIAERHGVTALGQRVDLRDPRAIATAAIAARQALGAVGGLVHSAGTAETTFLDGVTPENWDDGLALHARALLLLTQAFRADLKANPSSAIVGISSINATLGNGMIPIYSAGKGAMISLIKSMADELANDGIRVNALSPGMIDTPIYGESRDGIRAAYAGRIYLGRLGEPEEVGRIVRFLLSDEASYVTATEVVADGGFIPSQRA